VVANAPHTRAFHSVSLSKTNRRTCIAHRFACVTNHYRTALVFFILALPACAQGFNFNFGAGPGFPLSTTAEFVHNSYDFVVGGGPNLRPHVKMNADFMFHEFPYIKT